MRYGRARGWGATPEMNGLEALMWRSEADVRIRSTVAAVELLDRLPDWERLRAAHEWGSRIVPRFRERVVEPALGVGLPAWEDDPDFDLDRHLRRMRLAPGANGANSPRADARALLDLAADVASAPFDRSRPLWEAVLVDGLEDGRAAYILKLHHSLADGVGNVQLFDMLHSGRRAPTPGKPWPSLPQRKRQGSTELLGSQLVRVLRGAPAVALRTGRDGLGLAGRAAGQPRRAVLEALRIAASLDHVTRPAPANPSPLLAPRSLRWHFEALDVPLADLRGAAKAAGGSVNDAFVAALLGGFRRYHEEFGVPITEMPMAMPVSLRREHDRPGGNRFTGLRFAAPVAERDPRRRIEQVRQIVARERSEPALGALAALTPLLGLLSAPVSAALAARLVQTSDLQASNIPGLKRPVYMAGAKIEKLYPFGPLPGCAATISLVSHNATCCIGANLDAAAFTDTELFASCLSQGFEEIVRLATPRPRPRSDSAYCRM
jgi:WS/DGAT/MGAT family acyltransferase